MFRRAKSFIHRRKNDETKQIDLSETSHLRRNVVIDNKVLEQQQKTQISQSTEHLNNQVVEQLRRLNFGTAQKPSEALPKLRRSRSSVKRRSFHQDDSDKFTYHRSSGDVISQFGSQAIRTKPCKNQTTFFKRQISRSQEHLHDQVIDQIRKRNDGNAQKPSEALAKLHSEAPPSVDIYQNPREALDSLLEKIRLRRRPNSRSASSERPPDPPLFKNNDDFLLNRKSIDLGTNRERRKPDVVPPKSGLKTLFLKLSGSQKSVNTSQKSCDGASSTSSSACSSVERMHPAYRSERGIVQPVTSDGEMSRKRHHSQTKRGFVRNAPAYSSERRWRGEKIDRLGRDKGKT